MPYFGNLPPARGVFSLFAYGTLMLPEVMIAVCGSCFPSQKAVLKGYARYMTRNEVFPTMVMEKGACTEGLLYRGLDSKSIDLLDAFEGALYFRKEVDVTLADGSTVRCHAYVIKGNCRSRLSDRPWDAGLFRTRDLAGFLAAHGTDAQAISACP